MSCDICGRPHHPQRLPFLCAVDARNRCYDARVKRALAFMENESLQKQVTDIVESSSSSSKISQGKQERQPDDFPQNQSVAMRYSLSAQRAAQDRTDCIIEQADMLKDEVARAREQIEQHKATIARRKEEVASATECLAARRARLLEEAEKSIHVAKFKWNRDADAMAKHRGFLCMEMAKLYGLRRVKKSGSPSRYEYRLGGVEVFNLESIHAASPEQLSTSLANVAHVLKLASHYLSIRLPAELTLPHRDYPRPTIFTLQSSYSHGPVPFPGMVDFSADGGRENTVKLPRPRPLFVNKSLPVLAKEDPAVYSLFIEGATLLAYDAAWVCNSQGVPVGEKNSFEDVCHVGRNLYNLLIGQQQHQNANEAKAAFPQMASSPTHDADGRCAGDIPQVTSLMGRYSHGSAHSFLAGTEGSEFVRGFKLPTPMKLADKLKKKLLSEVAIPEWEVLEEDAWAGIDQAEDDGFGVVIDKEQAQKNDEKIRKKESAADETSSSSKEPRSGVSAAGTSGWTKVKHR